MKKAHPPKLRREVWATMGACERSVRKAQNTLRDYIIHDAQRHGGVLRLEEAQRLLTRVYALCADHEDALG